jgi:putative phosphoribosyl transferase
MKFASRQDAGRQLGKFLRKRGISADLVLGLPRGGIVVAAEVARELKLPLDILAVRKIGHPLNPEFAVGALAEPEFVLLHEESLRGFPVSQSDLDDVIAEEKNRLKKYSRQFHFAGTPSLTGKIILLVDDGLATGATMEAAVLSARNQNTRKIIVAAPVASTDAVEKLRKLADAVEILFTDKNFQAVGQYYSEFSQTTDDEVVSLLRDSFVRPA